MPKLYFDLDGVLRDICKLVFGKYPDTWDANFMGLSIIEIIEEKKDYLLSAPGTEYLETIQLIGKPIRILSAQPFSWRYYAYKWIEKHKIKTKEIIFTLTSTEKFDFIEEGDILIDDFPLFMPERAKNVILVSRPYNNIERNNCFRKIYSPTDLWNVLLEFKGLL